MFTRRRPGSVKRTAAGALVAVSLLAGVGCGFLATGQQLNAVLKQLVGQLDLDTNPDAVTIRIINQSGGLTEQLDLRVDGLLQTFTCKSEEGICDFTLDTQPSLVEAVEERRLDADGAFRGGRSFEGQEEFTFGEEDIFAGTTIVFQLSESLAAAFTM